MNIETPAADRGRQLLGRLIKLSLYLDRQAGQLTDQAGAMAFGETRPAPGGGRGARAVRGLVERLIEALIEDGGFRARRRASVSGQPLLRNGPSLGLNI